MYTAVWHINLKVTTACKSEIIMLYKAWKFMKNFTKILHAIFIMRSRFGVLIMVNQNQETKEQENMLVKKIYSAYVKKVA